MRTVGASPTAAARTGLLRLVGQVRGYVEHRVLPRLAHRLKPVLRHAPAEQPVVCLRGEERRPADRLLDIALGDDLLDRLADLDELGRTRPGMAIEPPARRQGIGVVMVADIGEQRVAVALVHNDAEIAVDAGRRERGEIAEVLREAAADQPPPADPRRPRKLLLRWLKRDHYGDLSRYNAAKVISQEWASRRPTGDPLPGTADAIYHRLDAAGYRPLTWRQIHDDLGPTLDPFPAANRLQNPPGRRPDRA
jgi:hypothetical protein